MPANIRAASKGTQHVDMTHGLNDGWAQNSFCAMDGGAGVR